MVKVSKVLEFFRFKTKNGQSKTVPLFSEAINATINKVRRNIQDIIFSLAISMEVSPKKLAKNLSNKDKLNKFASELVDELDRLNLTRNKKAEKELAKKSNGGVKVTVKKKTK